jgi:hypothetical protein
MTPEEALIILAMAVAAASLIILVVTERNHSFKEFMARKNKRRGGDK